MSTHAEPKKLYLSDADKKISGVCGGLGDYLVVDPTALRLAWVVLTVFTGIVPGVLAYFVAALIMPRRPKTD